MNWSRRGDLNPWPADYESAALPLSYFGPKHKNKPTQYTLKGAVEQWQFKAEYIGFLNGSQDNIPIV